MSARGVDNISPAVRPSYDPRVGRRTRLSKVALLAVGAVLSACGRLPPEAPEACGFPDRTELAFAGPAKLRDLWLGSGDPRDINPATVYVTAERTMFIGENPPGTPDQVLYCAIHDDGIRTRNVVPVGWSLPADS